MAKSQQKCARFPPSRNVPSALLTPRETLKDERQPTKQKSLVCLVPPEYAKEPEQHGNISSVQRKDHYHEVTGLRKVVVGSPNHASKLLLPDYVHENHDGCDVLPEKNRPLQTPASQGVGASSIYKNSKDSGKGCAPAVIATYEQSLLKEHRTKSSIIPNAERPAKTTEEKAISLEVRAEISASGKENSSLLLSACTSELLLSSNSTNISEKYSINGSDEANQDAYNIRVVRKWNGRLSSSFHNVSENEACSGVSRTAVAGSLLIDVSKSKKEDSGVIIPEEMGDKSSSYLVEALHKVPVKVFDKASTEKASNSPEYSEGLDRSTSFLFKGAMMHICTSNEGMYGEVLESGLKLVEEKMKTFGLNKNSVILDMGSGRGVPNVVFGYGSRVFASIGIEKCTQAFFNSLSVMRILLDREKKCLKAVEKDCSKTIPQVPVAFANEDITAFDDFNGVTHLYSFDAAMEGALINNMVYQFMNTKTAWFFASYHSNLISKFGLMGAKLMAKVPVKLAGSGEGRSCYIYIKDNWQEIQALADEFLIKAKILPVIVDSSGSIKSRFEISKWGQPMHAVDIIRLSRSSITCQEAWYKSLDVAQNNGTLTRSKFNHLYGLQIAKRREDAKRRDILLEFIANGKSEAIIAKRRLELQQYIKSCEQEKTTYSYSEESCPTLAKDETTENYTKEYTATPDTNLKSCSRALRADNEAKRTTRKDIIPEGNSRVVRIKEGEHVNIFEKKNAGTPKALRKYGRVIEPLDQYSRTV